MPPDASIRSPLILGSAVQSHRRPSIPVQQICCTIRRGGSSVTQAGDDTPGPGPAAQPPGTAPGLQRHHRGADLVYLRPGPQHGTAGRGGQVRPVGTVVPGRDPGSRGGLPGAPEGKGPAMSEKPKFVSYARK